MFVGNGRHLKYPYSNSDSSTATVHLVASWWAKVPVLDCHRFIEYSKSFSLRTNPIKCSLILLGINSSTFALRSSTDAATINLMKAPQNLRICKLKDPHFPSFSLFPFTLPIWNVLLLLRIFFVVVCARSLVLSGMRCCLSHRLSPVAKFLPLH